MYLLIFDQNLGIFASHVDGQQKLSKQRRLVIRQDGQDHSFCHIGQHSSPGNREMRSWLQGWRQSRVSPTWPFSYKDWCGYCHGSLFSTINLRTTHPLKGRWLHRKLSSISIMKRVVVYSQHVDCCSGFYAPAGFPSLNLVNVIPTALSVHPSFCSSNLIHYNERRKDNCSYLVMTLDTGRPY